MPGDGVDGGDEFADFLRGGAEFAHRAVHVAEAVPDVLAGVHRRGGGGNALIHGLLGCRHDADGLDRHAIETVDRRAHVIEGGDNGRGALGGFADLTMDQGRRSHGFADVHGVLHGGAEFDLGALLRGTAHAREGLLQNRGQFHMLGRRLALECRQNGENEMFLVDRRRCRWRGEGRGGSLAQSSKHERSDSR